MSNVEKPCYGAMFPDIATLQYNAPCTGAVFAARVESRGIGVQSAAVDADLAAWGRCLECQHFRNCYDLSMAKLAFAVAVDTRF